MIEKEKILVGVFVWWERTEEDFEDRDYPCIVTYVKGNKFRVKSLDDFKEIPEMSMDDNLHEMRICSLREIKNYFRKVGYNLEGMVLEKKKELADAEERLETYQCQAAEFLAKQEKR